MAARARSRRRGDGGAAALEFGLITPVLLLIVLGIIQYGVYFWGMQAGSATASQLARQLSVGNCQVTGAAQTFAANRLGTAAGTPTVGVVYQDGTGTATTSPEVGDNVQVSLSFTVLNLHLPLVPVPHGGTVISSANARMEYVPTTPGGCA